MLRALDHPNVVPLRDYVPERARPSCSRGCAGGTLEARLATRSASPRRAPSRSRARCSLALGEAHRLGILHRDMKPANVLFDDAGVARLGDFGVAHLGDLSATATAGVFGTLAYMSPEQREGRPATVAERPLRGRRDPLRDADRASDPRSVTRGRSLSRSARASIATSTPRHDDVVLRLLARDPASARPRTPSPPARAPRARLGPSDVDPRRPRAREPARERRVLARTRIGTVGPGGDARYDRWIDRPVVLPPAATEPRSLGRGSLRARPRTRALQPRPSRRPRAAGSIWLGAPPRRPARRPLIRPRASDARRSARRLHAEGFAHGRDRPGAACRRRSDGRGSLARSRRATINGRLDRAAD